MKSVWSKQVENLDINIFEKIPSQTSAGDRRSLLAIQRATAKTVQAYTYLEIGSHLGGSIQPHLIDARCKKIYSIDPRPSHQPDDRAAGFIAHYQDNSSARMLALLSEIGEGDLRKIVCIDSDASEIDLAQIENSPDIAFIDGEHTKRAVISDFRFCERVVNDAATIVFHDFGIIWPAIAQLCRELDRRHRDYIALKLEGGVFAIFFDQTRVASDPYLSLMARKNRRGLKFYSFMLARLKRITPNAVWKAALAVRNMLRSHGP